MNIYKIMDHVIRVLCDADGVWMILILSIQINNGNQIDGCGDVSACDTGWIHIHIGYALLVEEEQ